MEATIDVNPRRRARRIIPLRRIEGDDTSDQPQPWLLGVVGMFFTAIDHRAADIDGWKKEVQLSRAPTVKVASS
jgi:hypothetical protein